MGSVNGLSLKNRITLELLGVLLLIGVIGYLHFPVFVVNDANPEAMLSPATVAYMEQARAEGVGLREFFESPRFDEYRNEVKNGAYYAGGLFSWHFFSHMEPLANVSYVPFVKLFGVGPLTINAHSFFWMMVSFVCLYLLIRRAFSVATAFITILMLNTSLVWLIHVKIGYEMWMTSTLMVVLTALGLHYYLKDGRRAWLLLCSLATGLLLAVGWIGITFSGFMVVSTLIISIRWRREKVFFDLLLYGVGAVAVNAFFVFLYALVYRAELMDIYQAWIYAMLGRYLQGGVPHFNPSLLGKLSYGLKCIFIDGTLADHTDKYLSGVPAVPRFFSLWFFVGLCVCVVRRKREHILLLVWLSCVLIPMFTIYLYSHRYMLMGFPAMAAIASVGVIASINWVKNAEFRGASAVFWGLCIVIACLSTGVTASVQRQYYNDYLMHNAPDFERDRFRGHWAMSEWIKSNCPERRTLVILGDDSYTTPYLCYRFHDFDRKYDALVWVNHARYLSPSELEDWMLLKFGKYDQLVFVFSSVMIGRGEDGRALNDWSSFRSLYPRMKPALVYSYDNRAPYLFLFSFARDDIKSSRDGDL